MPLKQKTEPFTFTQIPKLLIPNFNLKISSPYQYIISIQNTQYYNLKQQTKSQNKVKNITW